MSLAFHGGFEIFAELEIAAHHLRITGNKCCALAIHHHHQLHVGIGLDQPFQLGADRRFARFIRRVQERHEIVIRSQIIGQISTVADQLRNAPGGALRQLFKVSQLTFRHRFNTAVEVVIGGNQHGQQGR